MTPIIHMQFGSHVYGTNLPTSDLDYKVVAFPSARDIVLQRAKHVIVQSTKKPGQLKNTADDIDVETFALHQYLKLLCDGQTVAIDMLFTPKSFYLNDPHPVWTYIQDNKHQFLHSGLAAFVGYVRQQANKYGIRGSRIATLRSLISLLNQYQPKDKMGSHWQAIEDFCATNDHAEVTPEPTTLKNGQTHYMLTVCDKSVQQNLRVENALAIFQKALDGYGERALQAERNQGVDWKALLHAVRVGSQAKELLTTGHITFPRPEAELLLEIRQGHIDYKVVASIIEKQLEEVCELQKTSVLRVEPNRDLADKIVFDTYRELIINS